LYQHHGYKEVITPNLYNVNLWKISGHYKNYKDNLYLIRSEDGSSGSGEARVECQGLKPMNCPAHCLMFKN